jgi:hypothetical protein
MMDTERLRNSNMCLASASELQTLVSSFLIQYAKHFVAFNTIRGTENEASFILSSEPILVTCMYVYLYNSSLFFFNSFYKRFVFFIVS